MLRFLLISILTITPELVSGQVLIEGKVFDATNNQPLAGAAVIAVESSMGTITDSDGYFQWPGDSTATVDISFIGYLPQRLIFEKGKFYNIGLSISETQLQEVVISAYRNGQRYQDVPGSISLITIKDLERGDGLTITPSLNRIPGVYMHTGALNTNRITIRGIGARSPFSTTKIRAYLNDIPLTNGAGETTIEDIDLGIVERVEVIKGPSSSIFGAGLGGTINYSVKKSPYQNTSAELGTKLGSYGLLGTNAGFQHGSDFGNINFSLNDLHSDGYRENNEYNRRSYSLSGQLFTGKKGVLTVIGNWINLKAFIPSSIDSITYVENPRAAAFTWKQVEGFEDYNKNLAGINYLYNLSNKWFISGSAFSNGRKSYELRPFNTLQEDTRAFGTRIFTGFENDANRLLSKFNAGIELFKDRYDWQTLENNTEITLSDNQENRNYYNIFSQVDLGISSMTNLVFGVNINNTSYRIEDLFNVDSLNNSGKYSFKTQWSPRLAVMHKLDQDHTLYTNVSHGFSPPTLEETLTPEGQVNPDIQPESGYNYEIGSRGTFLSSRLFYDISLYTMRIENLLVARRVINDIFVGVNAGKTTHSGFDLTLNFNLLSSINPVWSSATMFVSYMYADYIFKEFVDGDNDYSGNKLTGTPSNKLNLGMDFKLNIGLYGNFEYMYVDKIPMNDANTAISESYTLLNFKLGIQESFGNYDRFVLKLFGGINNLMDVKYASMISVNAPAFGTALPRYYYPGLPRNYYGGIELTYRLSD